MPPQHPHSTYADHSTWRALPALCLLIIMTGACSTTGELSSDQKPINATDLLVVDCLLPPQVRQLGTHITYLAQRRAIRTSGADCALRGGEYVAHNRADFKSALAVWLPLAQQGDPEAQTYVGEIYEKGLGTHESYKLAASWYQRAANQNYSRAQINLGYLFESGLGVKRDLARALNLYRQASGFTAAELEFVSSVEIANRRVAKIQQQVLQADVQLLQSEIQAGRMQLQAQQDQLEQREDEIRKLRASLTSISTQSTASVTTSIEQSLIDNHTRELSELQTRLDSTILAKYSLEQQLARESAETAIAQDRYSDTVTTLQKTQQELESNDQKIEKLEHQIRASDEDSTALVDALRKASDHSEKLLRTMTSLERKNQQQAEILRTQTRKADASRSVLALQIAQQKKTIARIDQRRQSEIASYQKKLATRNEQLQKARQENQITEIKLRTKQAEDAVKIKSLQHEIEKGEAELAIRATAIRDMQDSLTHKQAAIAPTPAERTMETRPSGPTINIIDPPVLTTRGSSTLTLSNTGSAELIGSIQPADSLFAFRINGIDHPVNDAGLFTINTSRMNDRHLELLAVDRRGASTRVELGMAAASDLPSLTAPSTDQKQADTSRRSLKGIDFGNYHALIIGNDSYDSLSNLKTAGNDAIAVERMFREKYGFRTVLLLDANQKTILSALERLRATLGQQDNLVIYYAGHGELDKQSGRGYWLPVDSETADKSKWIANSAVSSMIDTMKAKHVLVIADSCYSGYLSRSSIARPLSGASADLRLKWLKAVSQSRVRTVLSSGGSRPVLDGSVNSDQSIFATLFLDALERNIEVLEAYELFFELQRKVAESTARLSVEQIPQYAPIRHAGHQAGEFIFVPVAQTTVGGSTSRKQTTGR